MRIPLMSSYMGLLILAMAFGHSRAQSKYLSVPLYPQEANNWCWAASDQMVLAYYSYYIPQCMVVENQLHSGCCPSTPGGSCDVPGDSHIQSYLPKAVKVAGPLGFGQIMDEINANRPILFSKDWTNGGHLMVATGYKLTPTGIKYVLRNNSIGPSSTLIRYEEYRGGPGCGYSNKTDYINIF
jgi:hypothetical protein